MEKLLYLAGLQTLAGIGSVRMKALVDYFGGPQNAWEAKAADLRSVEGMGEVLCNNFVKQREKINLEKLGEELRQKKIQLCSIEDEEYPDLLQNIYNPPYIFYYRGVLPRTEKIIAMVGSREASHYGKSAARMIASDLAQHGVSIVSGAARGIDTAAHEGALAKGSTVAVLGCGLDIVYPPENRVLLENILERGAVISEYAPGTPPMPGNFPARNRIISGMAKGTVIVEAGVKSGALITAAFAAEEGRDVFAVPGNIFSYTCKGTNNLIKDGAQLIDNAFDIMAEYSWLENIKDGERPAQKKAREHNAPEVFGEEKSVYDLLDYETPLSLEEIVQKANLPLTKVSYILLQLGLRGLINELNGRTFIRRT